MNLKKFFVLMLVALTAITSSCKYDDDELWDTVNSLAERISALETLTKQMNSDIAAMQSIISALEKNVYISEVEKLTDGYILHFTDGTTATIKNGTNGLNGKDAPVINVKQENGVYYWTITVDGETTWLTDDKGNKLPVSGTDGENGTNGKNGVTPLLKVDGDGYWMVSYDNGSSYTYVLDSYGHKVYAVGPQGPAGADGTNGTNGSQGSQGEPGDSKFLNVEVKDGNVIITLNDTNKTQIIIPIAAGVSYTMDGEPVSNLNEIALNAEGEATVLKYEISTMSNATVEVLSEKGVKVSVEGNTISITRDTESDISIRDSKVVLLYYNDEQTLTSVLKFEEAWIVETDDDGNVKKVRVNSKYYTTIEEALAANNSEGNIVIDLADGEYNVTNCGGKNLTINGSKNVVLIVDNEAEDGCDYGFGSSGTGVGNYTFNGLTINTTTNTGNYKGYAYMKGTFNNCNFVGSYSLNNANDFVFNNCTFDFQNGYLWTWAANSVTFNGCTFNGNSKNILAHGYSSTTINIKDCKFNATEKGYASGGTIWTAAVEIDPAGTNIYTINFTGNNTKTENYASWYRIKDNSTGHIITGVE